jgi:hypothetical protein
MVALETLDLSGNELTKGSLGQLSKALVKHKQLKQLLLDDNEFGSTGAKGLAALLDVADNAPALEGAFPPNPYAAHTVSLHFWILSRLCQTRQMHKTGTHAHAHSLACTHLCESNDGPIKVNNH